MFIKHVFFVILKMVIKMAILLFLIFFIFLLVLYYDVYNIMRLSIIENLKVNKFIKIIISLLILAIPLLFYRVLLRGPRVSLI